MTPDELLAQPFGTLSDLIGAQAVERPDHLALIDPQGALSYRALDAAVDRIAAALQRDGFEARDVAQIAATASNAYAAVLHHVRQAAGRGGGSERGRSASGPQRAQEV